MIYLFFIIITVRCGRPLPRPRIRTTGQIEVLNTGQSVFLGERAGNSEDGNNRYNIGIGSSSLLFMGSGTGNAAIGFCSMQSSLGDYNTVAGYFAMGNVNSNGAYNTGLGQATLVRNSTGTPMGISRIIFLL